MDNIKIGLVGLDTSHSPAFAMLLNNPQEKGHVPGCQVVKAYPGGSELFGNSINRVEGFTKQFRDGNFQLNGRTSRRYGRVFVRKR